MQTYGDYRFEPTPYVEPEDRALSAEKLAKENAELEKKYKELEPELEQIRTKGKSDTRGKVLHIRRRL